MSRAACTWADDVVAGLDPASKGILSKLAAVSDEDDRAWMTISLLASRVGVSERTIQSRLRMLEGAGKDGVVYLRRTGEFYRYGTRDVPYYELMVDHEAVGAIEAARRGRKQAHAEIRSMGAAACTHTGETMGATVCTHSGEADDTICTPMGATVCTRKREPTEKIGSLSLTPRARTPEAIAEEILAAWSEGYRQRSGVREVAAALRRERKRGSDLEAVAAGCIGYAGNRKAWGATGGPVAPHKLIDSGRWETSSPRPRPKGSSGSSTGHAVPTTVRAAFVADHRPSGEALAKSYLDPCGWRPEDQTLLARTSAAERWLKERGYRVERLIKADGAR